ncbi:MAG: HEAT repeat domain-containing protein [Dehalococcoidales bacterium]|nr:HEAT repeat domain-containing protein [Dehalococcoidales bacterium]
MDPKTTLISAKEGEIDDVLDKWGFIQNSPSRYKKQAQIIEWLENFLPSEINDAFSILEKIQYKDDNMIHNAIDLLSRELKSIFDDDLSRVKFYPLGKSPSSSGGMYLYDFRKNLMLPEDNFPYSEFKYNLASTQALVFFDDMIGSGNQAVKFAKENIVGLNVQSYYISVFAFQDGLDKVRKEGCFIKVFTGCLLTNEERAFHEKSTVFTEQTTREKLRELCLKYGKQLFPNHPLGYDDSQALLVFPHNTPNNTLPIIWASTENEKMKGIPWQPVFERKKITNKSILEPSGLSSNKVEVRIKAYKRLGDSRDQSVIPHLSRSLEKEVDPEARASIFSSLVKIGGKEAKKVLIDFNNKINNSADNFTLLMLSDALKQIDQN